MNPEVKVYPANLDCRLLKNQKGGLGLILRLLGLFALCVVIVSLADFLLTSVSYAFLGWIIVAALALFAGYGVYRQQLLRRMSRSALVTEGDTVTLMTLNLENDINTCVSLIGFDNVSGPFNTQDLLGYGLGNTSRKKSGAAFNAAVMKMQDPAFVLDRYKSGYGDIRQIKRYRCTMEKRDENWLVFACVRENGGEKRLWRLPNVFGEVEI